METLIKEKELIRLCPKCMNGQHVDVQAVAGTASCGECGWTGLEKELIATLGASQANAELMLKAFVKEVQVTLAQHLSLPLGRLLVKFGFVQATDKALLSTYLIAVLKSVMNAIVLTYSDDVRKKHVAEEARRGRVP